MRKVSYWLIYSTYLLSYFVLLAFSIGVFSLFQPFNLVDNSKSKLICKNNYSYYIGPNLVFSFNARIDSYNDKKARKVCEYGIIRDYNDTFKTPEMNYTFVPAYTQESSWLNAVFAAFLTIVTGTILIETSVKILTYLIYRKDQISGIFFGKKVLRFMEFLIS